MADGRHFENLKYTVTRPHIVFFHQILHDNEDIGVNFNFSQKLQKYEDPSRWTVTLFENRKYAITRPHIIRPDYIYNMALRGFISIS